MPVGTNEVGLEPVKRAPDERPTLTFRQYSIAFHLAATTAGGEGGTARGAEPLKGTAESSEEEMLPERAMESFEDDMLLYAHRDEAPFHTRVLTATPVSISVRFPRELIYEAEGRRKQVRSPDADEAGRVRTLRLALAQTKFERSELAILTLVLTPVEGSPSESELNEYDVIKLAKLWEGGEGVGDDRTASFAFEHREALTLHDLAVMAFPGWQPLSYEHEPVRAQSPPSRWRWRRTSPISASSAAATTARTGYRVGTVELEVAPREWTEELFRDIAALKERREASDSSGERWDRSVAVGGILQGLLDFRAIEDYELADVFVDADVDADDQSLLAFHKGTLLSLTVEADDPDRPSAAMRPWHSFVSRITSRCAAVADEQQEEERLKPIGVDPYLAMPNIVLLHDEERLKTARARERDLRERQIRPLWRDRAGIAETENGLSDMASLLAQHLPNVFHYANERRLQQQGRQSRGLDDLEAFIRLRMDDLSSRLESRVRRRDRWTAILGIAVGVITAFLVQQVIEGRPLWLIVLAAAALISIFLYLRDRLF